MVAEFPAGANLKPGTADFASPSPASLQYAKRDRQLSSCRALGRSVLRFISREPFLRCVNRVPHHGKPGSIRSAKPLSPVKRMRPGPGHLGFEEPIACPDEIIRRHRIVGRIRDDAVPSSTPCPCLDHPHQPALEVTSPVPLQHTDPGEITAISNVR